MTVQDLGISIVIGIATGAASSFAIWLLVARRLRPSIDLSSEVTRHQPRAADTWDYRVKLLNQRRHNAYDLQVRCDLAVPRRVVDGKPQNSQIYGVGVSAPYIARLHGRGNRVIQLSRADLDVAWNLLPGRGLGTFVADSPARTLSRILEIPGAELRVTVFSVDGYSGARGIREQIYRSQDVVCAQWLRDSLQLAMHTYRGHETSSGECGEGGT